MEIPEGGIEKSWGWQKQVYSSGSQEIWMGFGKQGGMTSRHRHQHHTQKVSVIHGWIEVLSDPMSPTLTEGCSSVTDTDVPHRLCFIRDTLFIEVYEKLPDAPSVVQDTLRGD